jgi:hypothetical protein
MEKQIGTPPPKKKIPLNEYDSIFKVFTRKLEEL